MNFREEQEAEELLRLSPYAVKAAQSKGRRIPIRECDLRTCFQRDRDRIIHCKSFRRLKYKTQVFLSPKGDHYRTRLTHTLEVSQVARTISRCLRLNEDLTEAIALGHDLGHTPFGHIGESTLNRLMPGGFCHNQQSQRVVEKLENNGQGLNLCAETEDGIRNHSGKDKPSTLEGMVVRISDRVAYINHDIDDSLRGGIIRTEDIPKRCSGVLGATHSQRINTMITDIVNESKGKNEILMSEEVEYASRELRKFLFENVYHDEWRRREEERCDFILQQLFEHYLKHPDQLPNEYLEIVYAEGPERAVCDFIACMTDRYAVDSFEEYFVPTAFSVK